MIAMKLILNILFISHFSQFFWRKLTIFLRNMEQKLA